MTKKHKKIVLFGTFDGVHLGHENLFAQAKDIAEEIVVVIPDDNTVEKLKQYTPKYSQEIRKSFLASYGISDVFISSDAVSSWDVLYTILPDAILVGYDQDDLRESILQSKFVVDYIVPVYKALPYKENIYKNSLLNN